MENLKTGDGGMLGWKVEHISEANPKDGRGPTFNFKFPKPKPLAQITAFKRWPGQEFGGHFHKGDDPSKNPEIMHIISGSMHINFTSPAGLTSEAIFGPGDVVTIFPDTKHKARTVGSEPVIFIDARLTAFDPQNPDTYPS